MIRHRCHIVLPLLLLALSAPARADDDQAKARSTILPPSRPTHAERLKRGRSMRTHPTAWGKLKEDIKDLWSSRVLRRGTTAVYLVDAETGEELYSIHADDKVNPASNVKLISTATVLDAVGPDWRFHTRLFGPAPGRDGVSHGDVYLLGQADPTLGPHRLAGLAKKLAGGGLRRIEGDVVLSADVLRDTIGLPRIKLEVKATKPGEPPEVSVSPESDYVRVEIKAKTRRHRRGRRLRIKSRIEEGEDKQPVQVEEITGTIRRGHTKKVYRGVHRRSSFTAQTLRAALEEAGVEVTGGVRIEPFEEYVAGAGEAGYLPVLLGESRSRPIGYLVHRTNKRSLNFMADRMVIAAGAQVLGTPPRMEAGITIMKRWLARAGVDPNNVVLDTGSGLSYHTELTARQIVRVLRTAAGFTAGSPKLHLHPTTFRRSLSIGGVDGTLRHRFRGTPLQGKIIGKTGTLTRIIALSGFVSAGGRTLCFSLVTNGHGRGARWGVRHEHEHIVEAMFDFLKTEAQLAKRDGAAEVDESGAGAEQAAARATGAGSR